MHIPDAYLSPVTQAVTFVMMAPVWVVAARRTRKDLTSKQAPLLSMGAAFCFAVQMFNIPAVGGTTAHALGAALLAILVGPWAAVLGLTLCLVIQALLFGDGGILSLGANCFDMAFVAVLVSYGIYRLVSGSSEAGSPRRIVAAGLGAYVGTVTASLSAGILLGIQPLIAHDAAGHALYCPFGLSVSIPAMVMSHPLVAAPAEAIITVAALAYVSRSFPELLRAQARAKVGQSFRLARTLIWVLVLTPLGLIAGGSAFGEWDVDTLRRMIGYTPTGAATTHDLIKPLLPDYGFAGIAGKPWEIVGYLVSALVGSVLVAVFTRSVVKKQPPVARAVGSVQPATMSAPAWFSQPNPKSLFTANPKSPWLENSVLKMRSTIANTVASEQTAYASGLLQSINPLAKTIGFLTALLAVGLSRTPGPLAGFLVMAVLTAWASKVPLKEFLGRVGGAVLFFGLVLAVPVSLQTVTAGPAVFRVFGVGVSGAGLNAALLIVLRLAAGISLAVLWHLTTRWYDILRTLRSLGVPRMFITTAALTYRYLFVMVETLAEMVEARTSRQVGACDKRQARIYAGSGAAILFAKSLAFTEEMHWAMVSRTCDGNPAQAASSRWTLFDAATAFAGVAALTIVLIQGTHYVV